MVSNWFKKYKNNESPELAHSLREYMSSKHQNIHFTVEQKNISSLLFLETSKFVVKMVNLSLVFTENQHLVGFSPIMKVSFQRTKREDFYTHYFIGVLAYVVISRHFILKSIIWRLSSWKTIIPRISLIRVLNHFLISCIHLKLLFRMYL